MNPVDDCDPLDEGRGALECTAALCFLGACSALESGVLGLCSVDTVLGKERMEALNLRNLTNSANGGTCLCS